MTATAFFECEHHTDVFKVPNSAFRWKPSSASLITPAARDFPSPTEQEGHKAKAVAAASSDAPMRPRAAASGIGFGCPTENTSGPWTLTVGITDDTMTEIRGEGVHEKLKVVIGEGSKDDEDSDGGATNPFLPKLPRGAKPR